MHYCTLSCSKVPTMRNTCYIFYDSQTNSVYKQHFLCFHIYFVNLEHFKVINIYIYR